MHLDVPIVPVEEMRTRSGGESSITIKERVDRARDIQRQRFAGSRKIYCNSQMGSREIEQHCRLDDAGHLLLEKGVRKLGLSARAYHRILKIARTIADMEGSVEISSGNVAEAIQYRRFDRKPQAG